MIDPVGQMRPPRRARRGSTSRLTGLCLWLLLLLSLTARSAMAEGTQLDEYDVKSAYLFNIARFVEWPPSSFAQSDSSFVILVVGTDPFGPKLDERFRGRTVHGHGIRVERRQRCEDLPPCHVLFVALPQGGEVDCLLKRVAGSPVLTIGDRIPLARSGGIMNFFLEDDAVRFEINPAAIERSGLRVSSKLLTLARIVETGQ